MDEMQYIRALLDQRDNCLTLARMGDLRPLQRWCLALSYWVEQHVAPPSTKREIPALLRRANGDPET
jgi:hypothetical protein